MIVLGLSLGHDASATVLREGKIVAHILRERHSGVRHHLGIDRATIELALGQAGIAVADISAISIAATQQIPCLVNDPDYLHFREKFDPENSLRNFRLIDNPYWKDAADKLIVERWSKDNDPPPHALNYLLQCEQSRHLPMATHKNWEILGILSPLYGPQEWLSPYQLDETGDRVERFLSLTQDGHTRQAFHFPLEIQLDGRSIPGWFINHHMAHAASGFFSAPEDTALIFTHDGGTGSDSGFVFLGSGNAITGLGPHYLECGQFYDYVAHTLGLGAMGGAGKLMGLAPYGDGRLDNVIPAGTRLDWDRWTSQHAPDLLQSPYKALFNALVVAAGKDGLDSSRIGQADYVLTGAPPEIAHAVQDVLEKSIFSSIGQTVTSLKKHGFDTHTKNLCVSGGVALNCPANSKLWNSGLFQSIHIEPHCEDGGLSIGAAHYAYRNLMGGVIGRITTKPSSRYAMMGPKFTGDIQAILNGYSKDIQWEEPEDWMKAVAQAIAEDHIVAIFHDEYETGPRALGHRSILANPTIKANWKRVNLIKKREEWRPFAPAVLVEDLEEWFEGGPPVSPFMLFTHRVRADKVGSLPAVTHVDKTSRVQTVESKDNPLYEILVNVKKIGLPPVVLNTSFNGPGQPILQDPHDAIEMLLSADLGAIFLNGIKITRKKAAVALNG